MLKPIAELLGSMASIEGLSNCAAKLPRFGVDIPTAGGDACWPGRVLPSDLPDTRPALGERNVDAKPVDEGVGCAAGVETSVAADVVGLVTCLFDASKPIDAGVGAAAGEDMMFSLGRKHALVAPNDHCLREYAAM